MKYYDLTPKPRYIIIWIIDEYGFVDFKIDRFDR